ncbi:beta-lactamase related protein [Bifidobacterium biavatii DSM 23969]|uniref:Beta-lactamase related protein n=2 Tax=Bifidobacterium biavatii TaxID=762212 RepID=A0A087A102_9BIFI|nr:beta-lactamase related protein [Bifidobacterium biavatii DSM 23969]
MEMNESERTLRTPDANAAWPAGLDPRVDWSVMVRDAASGELLYERTPDRVLKTASIGKLFLLMEVMRAIEAGELGLHEVIDRDRMSPDDFCEDSGILYLLDQKTLTVHDLGFLIGAFSDNYATNLLVERVGLEHVQAFAKSQGFEHSALLDYVRMELRPNGPDDMSCGCARELCDYMMRLNAGTLVSPAASAQIERWLGADTDTSMASGAFNVDPLAHWEAGDPFQIRHKTGTESDVRCDVGIARHAPSGRTVAYAILANWDKARYGRLRDDVLTDMRRIGESMRQYIER